MPKKSTSSSTISSSFSGNHDVELTSEWMLLCGEPQAGSESNPHTRNATVTLTNTVPDENISGMGDRGILVVGGTLSLHGDRENASTKLAATAEAGSTRIEVLDASASINLRFAKNSHRVRAASGSRRDATLPAYAR